MTIYADDKPLKVSYQEEFFKYFPYLDTDGFAFVKIQFDQIFKVLVMGLKKELNLISEFEVDENSCIPIT